MSQLPSLGRIVHYRGRHGVNAMRAAIVTATVNSLDETNVASGNVPGLTSDTHVHLWVFTPGMFGGFPEFDVPMSESTEVAPGSWCWPPRV
jgi:hypothetical protein